MTDLPHVAVGTPLPLSEEHTRVFEAWWREHNDGPLPAGSHTTVAMYNAAVDWWNALGTEPGNAASVTVPGYSNPNVTINFDPNTISVEVLSVEHGETADGLKTTYVEFLELPREEGAT